VVRQYQARVVRPQHVASALGGVVPWILAGAFLLPLAARTIGPAFTAPVAPLADKFRGAGTRTVQSGALEYQNWWEGFRDPTLNKLIQIAYNQNLTLLSAGTRVLQARAVLGIAIGVTYPQVQQGTESVIYNRTSASTPLSGPKNRASILWLNKAINSMSAAPAPPKVSRAEGLRR
jgi:outer membrane protein TolC